MDKDVVMTTSGQARRNSSGLARDIEILELLGESEAVRGGGLGVLQISQQTGRDKAIASRTLATLADAGLLERDPETLKYRLGARLFALAARTTESRLLAEAGSYLRRIAQATRETTHLCILRGGNVLTILSELSPHEFRTTGWEGVTTAAWRTPSGRVLLSDWDEPAVEEWYAEHGQDLPIVGPIDPVMGGSRFSVLEAPPEDKAIVTDYPSLLAELKRVRARGYALLDEELERGVVGASAPVRDFNGRIIAAINVSAPKGRVGDLDRLGRHVAASAAGLSRHLGHEAG